MSEPHSESDFVSQSQAECVPGISENETPQPSLEPFEERRVTPETESQDSPVQPVQPDSSSSEENQQNKESGSLLMESAEQEPSSHDDIRLPPEQDIETNLPEMCSNKEEDSDDSNYDPAEAPIYTNSNHSTDHMTQMPLTIHSRGLLLGKSYVDWFKEITTFYRENLYQHPDIRDMPPHQRSSELIKRFNSAHGLNVNVYINFECCTSFNLPGPDKPKVFDEIPTSAYNLRPDLTRGATYDEDIEYANFLNRSDEQTSRESDDEDTTVYIGKIPSRFVVEKMLFRAFAPYGNIRRLEFMGKYAFIDFSSAAEAEHAIKGENHVPIFGSKWLVDLSKSPAKGGKRSLSPAGGEVKKSKVESYLHSKRVSSSSQKRSTLHAKFFHTTDPAPNYFSAALANIERCGVRCTVMKTKQSYAQIDQALVKKTAYDGFEMTVVFRRRSLDVTFYTTDEDGSIKFDEYSNITINDTKDIIREYRKKNGLPELPDKPRDEKQPRSAAKSRKGASHNRGSPNFASSNVVSGANQLPLANNRLGQQQQNPQRVQMPLAPYPQFNTVSGVPKNSQPSQMVPAPQAAAGPLTNMSAQQLSQMLQGLDPNTLQTLLLLSQQQQHANMAGITSPQTQITPQQQLQPYPQPHMPPQQQLQPYPQQQVAQVQNQFLQPQVPESQQPYLIPQYNQQPQPYAYPPQSSQGNPASKPPNGASNDLFETLARLRDNT